MLPKSGAGVFSPHPQDSVSSVFAGFVLKPDPKFFAPNLNLYLALLSAILLTNIFLLLWEIWLFPIRLSLASMTDKGKPFERMGRKTTGLFNGSWVAELTSPNFLSPFFERKDWAFFMRNPGSH